MAGFWKVAPDGRLSPDWSCDNQREFVFTPARESLFSGMYGSGKSVAMCFRAWLLAERYAGIRGAVMRRRYEDLKISTLRLFPKLFGDAMWKDGLIGGEKEPAGFAFRNGSTIDFLGISGDNNRAQKLLSTEYGFLMADEINELSEAEWELAMGRLRQNTVPIRAAFGACNPDSPHHWLYHRFGIAQGANRQWADVPCPRCAKRGPRPSCAACHGSGTIRRLMRELFMSGPRDNDANHPAEYIAWRASLTGMRAARYRDGLWVAYEGSVFERYDPNVHLCDRPAAWGLWGGFPPPDWPRVRGIDLGYDNPFVCQWWAISPDGHWYRYRERYLSLVTVPKHAEAINAAESEELATLQRCAKEQRREREFADYLDGLYLAGSYCDHDRGERAQLEEAGIYTSPAVKDISAGLDHLVDLFDPDRAGGPRIHLVRDASMGRDPRLAFERLPTSLEDELPGYIWDKNTAGTLAGRRKGLPVDRNNHAIDAMRYALYSHFRKPQVAIY